VVAVHLRAIAVGDGVAKRDDRRCVTGRLDVDLVDEKDGTLRFLAME
jgi:hypothetical protein